jgi:hypothetical protein
MAEQNQSLFSRYLHAVRANPGSYIMVKNGNGGFVTFRHECWLFANATRRIPRQVNGHYQLTITAAQAKELRQKFEIIEV